MSDAGFCRLETYSRIRRRASRVGGIERPGRPSIEDVLTEAMRIPGECPHISDVRQPEVLFGNHPLTLLAEVNGGAGAARDPIGRKIRKDALLLLTAVATYPDSRAEVEASPTATIECVKWCSKIVEFFHVEFGEHLHSVVKHLDETHIHVHGFVRPLFSAGETNVCQLHPGKCAEKNVAKESDRTGRARKHKYRAYRTAMREFQDRYYQGVSVHFGHGRFASKKKRASRPEWEEIKTYEKAALAARREAERILEMAAIQTEAARIELQAELDQMRAEAALEILENSRVLEQERRVLDSLWEQLRSQQNLILEAAAKLERLGQEVPPAVARVRNILDPSVPSPES